MSPLVIINVAEYSFYDSPSGAARLASDLAKKQVEWGHRVYYVCHSLPGGDSGQQEREGMILFRIPWRQHPSPDPRNFLEKMWAMRQAVLAVRRKEGRIDVLHSHTPIQAMAALTALRGQRTLCIHSIHSPWLLETKAQKRWESARGRKLFLKGAAFAVIQFLEGSLFRRIDVLTSDSEYTYHEISHAYPTAVSSEQFKVLPGWVDTRRFTPQGDRTDWKKELGRLPAGPVFLTVRRLTPRNGLEMLLEAAALLNKRNAPAEIVIGGSGPLEPLLKRRIQELDLTDRVTLLGRVPEERLPVLYRSCDVFVLPTIALECFGLIVLEALASGCPVIATPVGAIPELMNRLFPSGLLPEVSAAALADAMMRFAQMPPESRLSPEDNDKIQKIIEKDYSLEAGTLRFKAIYESGEEKISFAPQ